MRVTRQLLPCLEPPEAERLDGHPGPLGGGGAIGGGAAALPQDASDDVAGADRVSGLEQGGA